MVLTQTLGICFANVVKMFVVHKYLANLHENKCFQSFLTIIWPTFVEMFGKIYLPRQDRVAVGYPGHSVFSIKY